MSSISSTTTPSDSGSPLSFTQLSNSSSSTTTILDNNLRRKPTRRANTAERRATHNAVERQRRETLNGRFLDLAALLPNLASVRRPSKSAIVNSSIALIHSQRRFRLSASRELRLLKSETDALRRELNEWRENSGHPRSEEPPRSVEFMAILTAGDDEESGAVMGMGVGMGWEMEIAEGGMGEEDEEDYYVSSPSQHEVVAAPLVNNNVVPNAPLPTSTPAHVHPHLAAAHAAHAANIARLSQRPQGPTPTARSITVSQPAHLQQQQQQQQQQHPQMQFDPNALFPLQIPLIDPTTANDKLSQSIWNAQIYNALAQQSQAWAQQQAQYASPTVLNPNFALPLGFAPGVGGGAIPIFPNPNAVAEDDAISVGSSSSSSHTSDSSSRRGSGTGSSGSGSSPATSTSTLASAIFMPQQQPAPGGNGDPFGFSRLSTNGWDGKVVAAGGGGGGGINMAALGMFM